MEKIKVLSVFGTRPEAIKMAPLVNMMKEDSNIESKVLVTGQHRDMLDGVLKIFNIVPDFDLNIMKQGQTIEDITSKVVYGVSDIIKSQFRPDILLVHGDTSTSFSAALAGFYNKVTVAHVEAGLRTYNIYSPYPEEMNRKLIGSIAKYHFAPTVNNENNLLKENISKENIYVTGNTVIDALKSVVKDDYDFSKSENLKNIDFTKKVILLTCHRRENWGEPMDEIFQGVSEIASSFKDIEIVFPVHLNPDIQKKAKAMLKEDNIKLIKPLEYVEFANLINKAYLVLTDSGGLQEEAPSLGKPVLVLRNETERPEAVKAGTVKIIGTKKENVVLETKKLLEDKNEYLKYSKAVNPYGDGKASRRIVDFIIERLKK